MSAISLSLLKHIAISSYTIAYLDKHTVTEISYSKLIKIVRGNPHIVKEPPIPLISGARSEKGMLVESGGLFYEIYACG